MGRSYGAGGGFVKPGYLLLPVIPRAAAALVALALVALPLAAGGQGLPAFAPLNPVAASRTGLYFQPYRDPRPGRWSKLIALDYASTIESERLPAAGLLLDSEILRLRVGLARDLGPRTFVQVGAELGGAYAGFLDGFLDWYHHVLGIRIPERDRRLQNDFLYQIQLPDAVPSERSSSDLFLGDVRLGFGVRPSHAVQTVLSLTLPTSTAPEGYGRGVLSAGLLNTVRLPVRPRLIYEGSLGLGYTPSHGDLGPFQRELLVAGSSGLRFRFWGRQSLYANLFYHSPYYHDTTLPALDQRELSLDFGWILATRRGPEWRIGLTEDLEPGGPAVDLIFRLGAGF